MSTKTIASVHLTLSLVYKEISLPPKNFSAYYFQLTCFKLMLLLNGT